MKRVVVVLGGGGVKGLAHVGAWKAIQEAGIRPAEIVGTSIGAFVGAAVAGGHEWAELAPRALSMVKQDIVVMNRWALLLNGIRQTSLFTATNFQAYIAKILPVTEWSKLTIPLGINAVDLETGETVWFGAGGRTDAALADAVYASCALPVFYPPARIAGGLFVDGGVLDTLPIHRAAERGAELIIAIDATASLDPDAEAAVEKGLVAIHHRVFEIVSRDLRHRRLAEWDGPEMIYVRPKLDGYTTFQFDATQYFLEEGYRATRRALAAAGYPPLSGRGEVEGDGESGADAEPPGEARAEAELDDRGRTGTDPAA